MKDPYIYTVALNRVVDIIESLDDIGQCYSASNVIDAFESQFPEGNKTVVHRLRDRLCDITFNLYLDKHGRK
jgi:hypothetical protein